METASEGEPAEVMHDDTTNSFSDTPAQENFSDVEKICHTGTEADRPYVFLELCAGSATLSAEVKRLGVEVLLTTSPTDINQSARSFVWILVCRMLSNALLSW